MSPYLQPLNRLLILTPNTINSPKSDLIELTDHYDGTFFNLLRHLVSSQSSLSCTLSHSKLQEIREPNKNFLSACNLFFQRKISLSSPNFSNYYYHWVSSNFTHVEYVDDI